MNKTQAMQIYYNLEKLIPNPQTELQYGSVFELLIAVVLSAQCTDKRVNIITKKLFKIANTPEQFLALTQTELEKLIFSAGYYRSKAKNILGLCAALLERHNGQVPSTFEQLVALPGVGRKTANVMLVVAFNTPALPVDTHVFRVANRLGLTKAKNTLQTEQQLAKLFDKQYWAKLHHLLILFGRYYCTAGNKSCNASYLQNLVDGLN